MSIFSTTIEYSKTDIEDAVDAIVRDKPFDVESRLSQLGLTKAKLISIVKSCAAGYGGVRTMIHPELVGGNRGAGVSDALVRS